MVMWVFGYASLIWKSGFEYDERIVGFIKGYRRAFHLACYEHRGTEELPARVATLEPADGFRCWGVALCIKDDEAAQRAMSYLHVRESEYDLVRGFEFFTESSPDKPVVSEVLVFMSTLDKRLNKYYLGAAPIEKIAWQIATATGPCGPNCDYLFRLVDALREIGHEDADVIELARVVRKMMLSERNAALSNQSSASVCSKMLAGVNMVSVPKSPLIASPVQGVSLNHSPVLLKSQAT